MFKRPALAIAAMILGSAPGQAAEATDTAACIQVANIEYAIMTDAQTVVVRTRKPGAYQRLALNAPNFGNAAYVAFIAEGLDPERNPNLCADGGMFGVDRDGELSWIKEIAEIDGREARALFAGVARAATTRDPPFCRYEELSELERGQCALIVREVKIPQGEQLARLIAQKRARTNQEKADKAATMDRPKDRINRSDPLGSNGGSPIPELPQ